MIAETLKTEAGQRQHYAAVKARMSGNARILPRVRERPAPVLSVPYGVPVDMMAEKGWKFLVALSAARRGVGERDILGNTRDPNIVAARHEAIALIRSHTSKTYPEIGRIFNIDHSTAIAAVKKVGQWTPKDRISADDEAKMVELRKQGMMLKDIAALFGRNTQTVQARIRKVMIIEAKNGL